MSQQRDSGLPSDTGSCSIGRRTFLQALGGAFGGLALSSCGGGAGQPKHLGESDGGAGVDSGVDGGGAETMFDVWREVQSALRQSPDHLPAQAGKAVASKDPAKILAFVSESIATIPGTYPLDHSLTDMRWGSRGVLRGGAGTMREKAELLAELYQKAGFDAKVVSGPVADPEGFAKAGILRPIARVFNPPSDPATFQKWKQIVGAAATPASVYTMLDLDKIHTLAQTITAALPADWKGLGFNWGMADVPLVQVTVGGQATYANPNVPGAVLGQSYTSAPPVVPYWGPAPFDKMKVTLSMCPLGAPSKRVTLAQAEYSMDQLVGRQIAFSFAPLTPSGSVLDADPKTVSAFVPTIAVRGVDMTADQTKQTAVLGGILTLAGDYATMGPDGIAQVNGQPLSAPTEGDAAIAARIASMQIDLQAQSFPMIRARVKAFDSAGKPVPGLSANALSLQEEGQGMVFTLTSNQTPPPRVLFVLDSSGSIPPEFLGANLVNMVNQVAGQVLAANPGAQFSAIPADGFSGPCAYSSDPAALDGCINSIYNVTSPLWESLVNAVDARPSAIVFVTDGVADYPPSNDTLMRIAAGPPVIMIGVGTPNQATLEQMATAGHGQVLLATQASEAVTAIVDFLAPSLDVCYELRYQAPVPGQSLRHVALTAMGSSVAAAGTYAVPAQADQVPPAVLGALYVTVDAQGLQGKQVTRLVAGRESLPAAMSALAVQDEIRYAMMGGLALSVEGEAPSLSQWLDDVVTGMLTLEPLRKAQEAKDATALGQALDAGFMMVPIELSGLHIPLPPAATGAPTTYNVGCRAVLLQSRCLPATQNVQFRADILPVMRYMTTNTDGRAAALQTLEKTLTLAFAEDAIYQTSTVKQLAGKSLVLNSFGVPALTAEQYALWKPLLSQYDGAMNVMPTDGQPMAMWSIEPNTGTILGVLADGSGAGQSLMDASSFDVSLELLRGAAALGSLVGASFMFGVWLSLGQAIVEQVKKATIAIATMETWTPGNQFGSLCGFLCDTMRSAVFEAVGESIPIAAALGGGALAPTLGAADNWYQVMHGGALYNCGCPS